MFRKQFISLLFTSVLMANLGHNIIPHHHHIDNIQSCHGCNDHNDGRDAFHSEDPISHCFAFNGMEYYPATEKHSTGKPFKTSKYICLSQIIKLNQPISDQKIYYPLRGSPSGFTFLPGSSIGLRAPPFAS